MIPMDQTTVKLSIGRYPAHHQQQQAVQKIANQNNLVLATFEETSSHIGVF